MISPGTEPGTRPGTGLPEVPPAGSPAAAGAATDTASGEDPADSPWADPGPGPGQDLGPEVVGNGPGPVASNGSAPDRATLADLDRTERRLTTLDSQVAALAKRAATLDAEHRKLAAKAEWQRVRREVMGDALGRLATLQYSGGQLAGLSRLLTDRSGADSLADRQSADYQARHAFALAYQEARRVAAVRAAQAASAAAAASAAEQRRNATAASGPALDARRDTLLSGIAARFGDGSWTPSPQRVAPRPPAASDLQPDGKALRAVLFALAHIGTPYVWGGTSPSGYDCSGLTSQAWKAAGVSIPRTSQAQWAGLPHVPRGSRLRPGDLVIYFPGATHVGMYIGDGLVVHAPRPGTVVRVTGLDRMPSPGVVRPDY